MILCNSIYRIEEYLLNSAKLLNIVSSTHKKPIKAPITNKYLKQKQPSLTTIDSRLLNSMNMSINPNRMSNESESLNTTDCPMHPNWSVPELAGHEIQELKYVINDFHLFKKKKMKIAGTT